MIATTDDLSRQAAAAYAASEVAGCAALQAIAASLALPDFPGAIFAVHGSGGVLCVAAPDWRHWRRLAPLLTARIGLTLSNFPSPVQEATPSARLTALLGGFTPRLWCRVDLAEDGDLRALAIEACGQLVRDVAAHAPLIAPPVTAAGVAELLTTYESALQRGEFDCAGQVLDALQRGHHLDAVNARFLRLRWLDAQGPARRAEALQVAAQLQGLPVPKYVRCLMDRLVGRLDSPSPESTAAP